MNVNDWERENENRNRLEQSYGETISKMIKENNAEILSEMINTNESKQSLISKNIVERENVKLKSWLKKSN